MALQTATITASAVALTGLVTPAEYFVFTGNDTPTNVAQIEGAIFDATEYIMKRLGRWLVSSSQAITITETFNGHGTSKYIPKQGDVLSLGIVENYLNDAWETVNNDTYNHVTDGDSVYSRDNYIFTKGNQNWRITYTFGLRGGIPRSLKRACLEIARYYVTKRSAGDVSSQTTGEQSFTYFSKAVFPDVEGSDVSNTLDYFIRYYTIG